MLFAYDTSKISENSKQNYDLIQRLKTISLQQCENQRNALLATADQWTRRERDWRLFVKYYDVNMAPPDLSNIYKQFVAESVSAAADARKGAAHLACRSENDTVNKDTTPPLP